MILIAGKQASVRSGQKSFLRWAGGKTKSVSFLRAHMPSDLTKEYTYFEPFLGAGSLFFNVLPAKAILSDTNADLIDTFKAVRNQPELLYRYLREHFGRTTEAYYYEMRARYNASKPSVRRAALFIYLNKTCFNGIWRVNKKGKFNVPYGKISNPCFPNQQALVQTSQALTRAQIVNGSYKDVLDRVKKGDFIYLDPPYLPLSDTSKFTEYTSEGFGEQNQREVASFAKYASDKGCFVLISNSDTPFIRSLYTKEFNLFELEVERTIRADGHRYKVKELAFTNYDLAI